jgi:hypothetical protein
MTSQSFWEVQQRFRDRLTITGGIPSVSVPPDTIADRAFIPFIEKFLSDLRTTKRLILGVSNTTPPAAPLTRLVAIGEQIRQLAPG